MGVANLLKGHCSQQNEQQGLIGYFPSLSDQDQTDVILFFSRLILFWYQFLERFMTLDNLKGIFIGISFAETASSLFINS